jgi:acyl-coenzyme A thioesterase PaaI-like protein
MSVALGIEPFVPVDVGRGFSNSLGELFIDRATSRLAFRVGPGQCNPVDTCHGGAIATFADTQIIAVDPGSQTREEHHPTISLSIDFVGAARLGDWVVSEVVVDRRTSTLLFTRAVMRVADRMIARSSAIYRLRPPLAAAAV